MRGSARQDKLAEFASFIALYDVCAYAREQGVKQPWTADVTMNAYDLSPRMADREPSPEATRASLKELGFRQANFLSFNLFLYETVERLRLITNRSYLETLHLLVAYRQYKRLKSGRIKCTKRN